MFETTKIKRILSRLPKTDGDERKKLIERLVSMGGMPVRFVADELRFNRMLFAHAFEIFKKLYKKEHFKTFVEGLGDGKENVRELYKQTLRERGKEGIVPGLVEHLADDDHMIRIQAGELIEELGDASIASRVIPLLKHDNREVKKVAMEVLCAFKAQEATKAILPLLDETDAWVRRRAVDAICLLKDRSTVDRLLEALAKERDNGIQLSIVRTLGEIGGPETAAPILPLIKSRDMVLRQNAVDAVVNVGDSSIISKLMDYLGDEDVNIRRAAVDVLNGLKDPTSGAALIKALKDGDWWVREIATEALSELGGSKICQLIMSLLHDGDEGVRRSAVEFFCKVKDPGAYDDLVQLLDDKDWWVREKAITALGLIGDPRAVPEISRMVDDREVIWAIPKALSLIGGAEVLAPLEALLANPQKQVRLAALRAICTLDGEETLDYLKEMVRDEDAEIQDFALKQLREKTGRIWLLDEVLEDLEKTGKKLERLIGKSIGVKPGDMLTEAILVVDIANSTDIANMYGDHLALELVNELSDIIEPVCQKESAQFQKSTGDGFLITFPAVSNAVALAVKVLKAVTARNATADQKHRIDLRFAINLGETRVDSTGDRLGSAVNMAFRVEGVKKEQMIPAPDGVKPEEMPVCNRICLTEPACQELQNDPSFEVRLLGFFELKGFTGLHRVYELIKPSPTTD